MQVAILVHSKQILEAALGHFQGGLADSLELVLDVRVILVLACEHRNDLAGLSVAVLEQQPAGRLGQVPDGAEDDEAEDDLEGERGAPRGAAADKREAQVNPVRHHDTARDQGALDHDHGAAVVR